MLNLQTVLILVDFFFTSVCLLRCLLCGHVFDSGHIKIPPTPYMCIGGGRERGFPLTVFFKNFRLLLFFTFFPFYPPPPLRKNRSHV